MCSVYFLFCVLLVYRYLFIIINIVCYYAPCCYANSRSSRHRTTLVLKISVGYCSIFEPTREAVRLFRLLEFSFISTLFNISLFHTMVIFIKQILKVRVSSQSLLQKSFILLFHSSDQRSIRCSFGLMLMSIYICQSLFLSFHFFEFVWVFWYILL